MDKVKSVMMLYGQWRPLSVLFSMVQPAVLFKHGVTDIASSIVMSYLRSLPDGGNDGLLQLILSLIDHPERELQITSKGPSLEESYHLYIKFVDGVLMFNLTHNELGRNYSVFYLDCVKDHLKHQELELVTNNITKASDHLLLIYPTTSLPLSEFYKHILIRRPHHEMITTTDKINDLDVVSIIIPDSKIKFTAGDLISYVFYNQVDPDNELWIYDVQNEQDSSNVFSLFASNASETHDDSFIRVLNEADSYSAARLEDGRPVLYLQFDNSLDSDKILDLLLPFVKTENVFTLLKRPCVDCIILRMGNLSVVIVPVIENEVLQDLEYSFSFSEESTVEGSETIIVFSKEGEGFLKRKLDLV